MILPDLINDEELNAECNLYQHRFASEVRSEKRLLLHGIDSKMSISLVRGALNSGWTVSVIREDASDEYLGRVRSLLGSHMYIMKDKGLPHVCVGEDRESLDVWLSGKKADLSKAYSWKDDECAVILFTSGSTGEPKGVCHSLGNIVRSAELFVEHFEVGAEDHLHCLAPIYTMSGFRSLILPIVSQTKVSLIGNAGASFLEIIKSISDLRPTKIICGPVFVRQLAAYGERLTESLQGVKVLFCTGADLNEGERKSVEQALRIPVLNYYGLTETSGIVLAETEENRAIDVLPPLCRGVECSLIEIENANDIFQLIIKSPNIFLGYLGEELSRKESFDTGDLVQEKANGSLSLVGRLSGAVKAPSTEWVFSDLLGSWLKKHPDITDAVVKVCRVSGGYGMEIWVDSVSPLDFAALDKSIVGKFGLEYKPVKWHDVIIKRNNIGKIDDITENHRRS